MKVSVIIPAYNEATRLPPSLHKVCDALDLRFPGRFEVLVVDDGSADGTAEAAAAFEGRGVRVLRLPANRGKGAALKAGVLASQGDEVLLCDADLSTPIEDLEILQAHLPEAPVVFGSRAVAGANITLHQPFYRELMGKTFNLLIRILGLSRLKDTQCGFKLLRGEVARELFAELTVERFAFDVELAWLARRRGYEIREVPVTWANSASSRVDPIADSLRMLVDILRFRFRRRAKVDPGPPPDRP
jgi:dolichyl-phosphate beta-glucosyltransferase